MNNEVRGVLCDFQAKLIMSEILESIQTCFYKVLELSDLLDKDTRERLLSR